jgi:hypothetical protein
MRRKAQFSSGVDCYAPMQASHKSAGQSKDEGQRGEKPRKGRIGLHKPGAAFIHQHNIKDKAGGGEQSDSDTDGDRCSSGIASSSRKVGHRKSMNANGRQSKKPAVDQGLQGRVGNKPKPTFGIRRVGDDQKGTEQRRPYGHGHHRGDDDGCKVSKEAGSGANGAQDGRMLRHAWNNGRTLWHQCGPTIAESSVFRFLVRLLVASIARSSHAIAASGA